MKIFPERLKLLRGQTSQEDMGQKYGVTQSAYGKWEAGKAEPKFDILIQICEEYSVSSDWLLGLTEDRGGGRVVGTGGSIVVGGDANSSFNVPAPSSGDTARLEELLATQRRLIDTQQRIIESLTRNA